MFPRILLELISFLSYYLVEADLWVCMPALGGRIKVELDDFDKASRVYMLAIPTSSKKCKNIKSATENNNVINT